MAKASDLIGKSGAGGLGPMPKPLSSAFTTPPAEGGKETSKGTRAPKKEDKHKGPTKGKSGGGGTTSPSIRPKV